MAEPLERSPIPPSAAQLDYDDGEPLESARHRQQMTVLIESLEFAWQKRDDFYVGGNMFLYFSETQSRRNDFRGPDVFVVLNTTRRERLSWIVWEENGQAPDVIIELLSDKTEHVDRGEKMRIYGRTLKVGEYFLFDPFSGVLEGYELDVLRGRYVPKLPDSEGRLRCEQLGLYLAKLRSTLYAVDTSWLRWLDDTGKLLELPIERANAEVERANAEAERANAEAERAERLEAELLALKAKQSGG
ncbi:MAG TPA: Uma2 family endonuclease [Polyangiaceae bacterium]|nr:Uma2 family endonuclease [Polyangiaceae bacterium]